MNNVVITKESDARGSFCPGPLMELIRMVKGGQVGDVFAIISSDAGSQKDIPAWATKAGHEYLGSEPSEESTRFLVCKAK